MSYRNYYDTSSYRSRDTGRSSSGLTTDRPTSVTAKYTSTPTYKSSSIPVLNDRSIREETPISAIANRYTNYSKTPDKSTTKYEKKDYSKLTIPTLNSNRSRDVSPVSTASKYSLSRSSRHTSPERKSSRNSKETNNDTNADRDKDIPNKTDKAQSYGLSNYKLYPRTTSYTRSIPRTDVKPEITVNRYAIANRLSSSNYLRSPTPVKRSSLSPINNSDTNKSDLQKQTISINVIEETEDNEPSSKSNENCNKNNFEENTHFETITVVTRHTSPTPPGSSSYVRMRRADMAKTIEKKITRTKEKPEMVDKEIQSDRLDDPTRANRISGTSRTAVTNWTYYSPNSSSYTGYAGRYSTQYSNLREPSSSNSYNDRSSRSRSKEPMPPDNLSMSASSDNDRNREVSFSNSNSFACNEEIINVYDQNKEDDSSEIIINVNLKLKKARSPESSTELVSPEIIITNSHQLPPQPPKSDTTSKIKKIKIRKLSSDSSSDSSSSKKVGKKRNKTVNSADSDQSNEKSSKGKESSKITTKSITKTSSTSSIQNSTSSKLKLSKSRQTDTPESSITISTQSSISEDETSSQSKGNETSRTTADEVSLPTDASGKQNSNYVSVKNENGTEEAKSFLIRALAPVTNLFKLRHQENSDNSRWLDSQNTSESTGKDVTNFITESGSSKSKNSTDNIIASNDDNLIKLKAIRHVESGERAWWMESDSEKKVYGPSNDQSQKQDSYNDYSNDKQSKYSNISDNKNINKSFKQNTFIEEEKPWWLDSNANIPEGIERLTPPRKSSSDSDKSEKFNFFKVRRIESGDQKDWWITSNENSTNSSKPDNHNLNLSKSGSDQRSFPLRRIRHVESGEQFL